MCYSLMMAFSSQSSSLYFLQHLQIVLFPAVKNISLPLFHREESMPFCHYSHYFELYDIIALPLSLLLWKISSLSKKAGKTL